MAHAQLFMATARKPNTVTHYSCIVHGTHAYTHTRIHPRIHAHSLTTGMMPGTDISTLQRSTRQVCCCVLSDSAKREAKLLRASCSGGVSFDQLPQPIHTHFWRTSFAIDPPIITTQSHQWARLLQRSLVAYARSLRALGPDARAGALAKTQHSSVVCKKCRNWSCSTQARCMASTTVDNQNKS